MIKRLMLLLIRFYQKAISFFRRDAVFIRPVQPMPLPLLSGLARCEAVILRCGAS